MNADTVRNLDESLVHSQCLAEAACLGLNRTPYRPRNLQRRPQSAFRGVQASRLMARWINFGKVRGFTHRTSHSTVLRGVDDCLADCYYPGAGSRAFAKLPISIVFVNRPSVLRTRSRSHQNLLSQKLSLAGKEALSSSAFERQAAQRQTMLDLPPNPELCP